MVTGLSHVSIVVPDLDAALDALRTRFRLEAGAIMVNAEQGVRMTYIDLGNAKIELMEPSRPDSPVAKFLERNPKGGLHHFCLGVDDVGQATQQLTAAGVKVLGAGTDQLNVHGGRIAFVHPRDFLGALVELEEHQPDDRHG